MPPVMGQDYHASLTISGTTWYLTRAPVRGWMSKRDVNAFSPAISSGDKTYSSLSTWSVIAQDDFTHGIGQRRFEDVKGYHKSTGSVDTRHKGGAQLATRIVASDEDLRVQAYQMIDFAGNVYACFDGSDQGSELLSNTGFETAGGGGDDVWANWVEVKSSSTIADSVTVHGGAHACTIISGAASDNAWIYQDITTTGSTNYVLTFWTRVDAADHEGEYMIKDMTHSADIVSKTGTGVADTVYTQVAQCFKTPAGCTSVRIYLCCSATNADVVYYDDVSVKAGVGGVRKYTVSTGAWAGESDPLVAGSDCYCMLNNGAYLFVGRDGAQTLKMNTSGDWDVAGVDANCADFRYMAIGGGRLWASKDGDNHVHYATSIDGSEWDGDNEDINRITVGPGDPTGVSTSVPITGMQWFNGFLYVAREDGLWAISTEDNLAHQMLDWGNERRTTNGKNMRVFNDKLIIPVGPRLFAFTGTTISDITPPTIGHDFPFTQYGNYEALATFGPYLYVAAQEGSSTPSTEVLRPTGAGYGTPGWSAYPAGDNYTSVDEAAADYFTTFIYALSPSAVTDLYALADTSSASAQTIQSVSLKALVEAEGLGGSFVGKVRIGSTTYTHGTEQSVSASDGWVLLSWEWGTSPATSTAWTSLEIDGAQFGIAGYYTPLPAQLWCTQVWVEVSYGDTTHYRLLCFDGSAWHNLGSLDAGGKCLWVSAASDDLWVNDYDDGNTNYNTRYMQIQEHSFLPYDDYLASGTHELETSRVDLGMKLVDKCYHSLHVFTDNCQSGDQYLVPYYRTAGDTWVELSSSVTQSPHQEISLSDITGKYLDLKFGFVASSASSNSAQSPVLQGWAVECLARPDTIWGYTMTLELGEYLPAVYGGLDTQGTFVEWLDAVEAARASQVPVTLVTPWNESVSVFVSAVVLQDVSFETETNRPAAGIVTLSMVEAA